MGNHSVYKIGVDQEADARQSYFWWTSSEDRRLLAWVKKVSSFRDCGIQSPPERATLWFTRDPAKDKGAPSRPKSALPESDWQVVSVRPGYAKTLIHWPGVICLHSGDRCEPDGLGDYALGVALSPEKLSPGQHAVRALVDRHISDPGEGICEAIFEELRRNEVIRNDSLTGEVFIGEEFPRAAWRWAEEASESSREPVNVACFNNLSPFRGNLADRRPYDYIVKRSSFVSALLSLRVGIPLSDAGWSLVLSDLSPRVTGGGGWHRTLACRFLGYGVQLPCASARGAS